MRNTEEFKRYKVKTRYLGKGAVRRQEKFYQTLHLKTNLDTAKINIFHIHSISLIGAKWAKFIADEKL
jgi:hypothetical protein